MEGPKEILPKFNGNGTIDTIGHCKTCDTIWTANGVTDQDDWVRQFLATLQGVAIDWFSDVNTQKLTSWPNVKKKFIAEFQLLRDVNEIIAKIYSTKQGKNETIRVYARRLKELVEKMESQPADGLKKRWFIEGLRLALKKKMKIVPPTSYVDAYNKAMDLESKQKRNKKKKNKSSDSEDSPSKSSSSNEESSKKV